MGFMSGLAGAVGGVVSTVLGNNSAKHEAEKNRDFQEYMSNTAISRRMQDLRNAGLNPLLAVENASSGASTPSGSQAQIARFDPSFITALSNVKLQNQQGKVAKAEERKVNAEAQAQENENSIFETRARKAKLEADREAQGLELDKLLAKIQNTTNEKLKMEIYKNALESKGINISNEKAMEELKLLTFDVNRILEFYKNNPGFTDIEKTASSLNSPGSIAGGLIGLLNGAIGMTARNIYKNYEDNKKNFKLNKKYIPRKIKENRISR